MASDGSIGPGSVVGPYEIVRLIGRGGMARVWLGRHQAAGWFRALKELTITDRAHLDRLVREASLVADLPPHERIVRVYEVLVHRGTPVLVLEYVDGPDLSELLALRAVSHAEADDLAVALMDGLHHVHQGGIVHRDLKPQNVLLAASKQEAPSGELLLFAKIADFGIAKAPTLGAARALTRAGEAFGTPLYAPPEQFEDAATVDERADLFALGCVLYEALAGRPAFDGRDFVTLQVQKRAGQWRPLAELLPDVPPRMAAAVAACLSADPAHRPRSVAHLRELWSAADDRRQASLTRQTLERLRDLRRERLGSGPEGATESRAPAQSHLPPDRIGADHLRPDEQDHAAACARCRNLRARALPPDTNLPDLVPEPIGRQVEHAAIRSALDAGARLVTLKGPAGVGKTMLARHLARAWLDERRGEAWFAELTVANVDDPEARPVRAVARALGDPEPRIGSDRDLAEALHRRGPCLLVLDGCEQLAERLAPALADWLRCSPSLTLVVTSRHRLTLAQGRVIEVEPLDPAAGLELLLARVRQVRPDLDVGAWTETLARVVARLDGLPLALELVAPSARALSPKAILDHLERRFDLVRSDLLDQESRRRSLLGALDCSWELLTRDEQVALARCAVFRGGFDLDAAAGVLAPLPDGTWVVNVVVALVDKSLLRMNRDGRYTLLESVRDYADRHLSELGDREEAELRHARHFDGVAAGRADVDNLVAAARRSLARGDHETAARVAWRLGQVVSS